MFLKLFFPVEDLAKFLVGFLVPFGVPFFMPGSFVDVDLIILVFKSCKLLIEVC